MRANSRPTPKLSATDRIAKAKVQPATMSRGCTRRGSVNSRTKLSKPTLTYQPVVRAVPSSATKLPRSFAVYTVPLVVSVMVWALSSHTSVDS